MGARINFIFKQSDGNAIALYSHWGEDTWAEDLAMALKHAKKRRGDESYYVRMAISYFLQDRILDETGYGITAFQYTDSNMIFLDHPILIDLEKYTVTDETGIHPIDSFISYHGAFVKS